MRPGSIRIRSAIALSVIVTGLWLATALLTARLLSAELDEVFDSALQETGQRILQLAVVDVLNREEEGLTRRVTGLAAHDEHFTYVVRDPTGAILLTSHRANPEDFPAFPQPGFHQGNGHRYYQESAVRGTVILTIAEPLSHRQEVGVEMAVALALPLLVMVPLSVVAIFYGLGFGLRPLEALRNQLSRRGATALSAVPVAGLPSELRPIAETVNDLLARLDKAFGAERSFAANAAHELRTPLAGALAQVQRLRQLSTDTDTRRRADEVEQTLKRLSRLSERLMQLARAEGARLVADSPTDLCAILRLLLRDFDHGPDAGRVSLTLPDAAVLSLVDPDAVAIVARNLIENALRHGQGGAVQVRLDAGGTLTVDNDSPIIPPDQLASLTDRFVKGAAGGDGSGLGLAIVQTIAARVGSPLHLQSPVPGQSAGFRAALLLQAHPENRSDAKP
jgi:two-component system OmpR family sensor kinase